MAHIYGTSDWDEILSCFMPPYWIHTLWPRAHRHSCEHELRSKGGTARATPIKNRRDIDGCGSTEVDGEGIGVSFDTEQVCLPLYLHEMAGYCLCINPGCLYDLLLAIRMWGNMFVHSSAHVRSSRDRVFLDDPNDCYSVMERGTWRHNHWHPYGCILQQPSSGLVEELLH